MNINERVQAFCMLGRELQIFSRSNRLAIANKTMAENPWFTIENIELAWQGIWVLLNPITLQTWVKKYLPMDITPKRVGVVMAGNIPMVGFHDALCVLICGHRLQAKLSHKDVVLIKFIFDKLIKIEPRFALAIECSESIENVDGVIATGSDNVARYFEYKFKNIPYLLRRNKFSCAVLCGNESVKDLDDLGVDTFTYFGLGCRSVSKLYVPTNFNFNYLLQNWRQFNFLMKHFKYVNNYTYQKALYQTMKKPFIDGEHTIMTESSQLGSPIAVIFYEKYDQLESLKISLKIHQEKIQIIASAKGWFPASVPFGTTQFPQLDDYADGKDTMKFLLKL